jgi:hypothetical protein
MLLTVLNLALSEGLLFFCLTAVADMEYTDILATVKILVFSAQGFSQE